MRGERVNLETEVVAAPAPRDPEAEGTAWRRGYGVEQMVEAVHRDLEDLLNTRQRWLGWPAHLAELKQSLVNYGIPDFTGSSMGSADSRDELRHAIEDVIRHHEPRFQSVTVHLLDNSEPLDRTLRFRIDALLRMHPAPEPVVFDSALEPGSGAFEVKGET